MRRKVTWSRSPTYSEAVFDLDEIAVAEDVAYGTGRYAVRMPNSDLREGTYLQVWRLEADGEWRIDRIMFH